MADSHADTAPAPAAAALPPAAEAAAQLPVRAYAARIAAAVKENVVTVRIQAQAARLHALVV
jgi:hypothetical protein